MAPFFQSLGVGWPWASYSWPTTYTSSPKTMAEWAVLAVPGAGLGVAPLIVLDTEIPRMYNQTWRIAMRRPIQDSENISPSDRKLQDQANTAPIDEAKSCPGVADII